MIRLLLVSLAASGVERFPFLPSSSENWVAAKYKYGVEEIVFESALSRRTWPFNRIFKGAPGEVTNRIS